MQPKIKNDDRVPLIEYWRLASEAEYGIVIVTDNRKLLSQQLYRARGTNSDGEYNDIVMALPQQGDQIWLVKRGADKRVANAY